MSKTPAALTPLELAVLGDSPDAQAAIRAAYARFCRDMADALVLQHEPGLAASAPFRELATATRPFHIAFRAEVLRRQVEDRILDTDATDHDAAWALGVVAGFSARLSAHARGYIALHRDDTKLLTVAARRAGATLIEGTIGDPAARARELGALATALERDEPVDIAVAATAIGLLNLPADDPAHGRIADALEHAQFADAHLRVWAQTLDDAA